MLYSRAPPGFGVRRTPGATVKHFEQKGSSESPFSSSSSLIAVFDSLSQVGNISTGHRPALSARMKTNKAATATESKKRKRKRKRKGKREQIEEEEEDKDEMDVFHSEAEREKVRTTCKKNRAGSKGKRGERRIKKGKSARRSG